MEQIPIVKRVNLLGSSDAQNYFSHVYSPNNSDGIYDLSMSRQCFCNLSYCQEGETKSCTPALIEGCGGNMKRPKFDNKCFFWAGADKTNSGGTCEKHLQYPFEM